MGLRNIIDTVLFFALMTFFQYEISLFNKDLHITINEVAEFKALEEVLKDRGEPLYKDRHKDDYHRMLGGGGGGSDDDDGIDYSALSEEEKESLADRLTEIYGGVAEGDFSLWETEKVMEQEEELHNHLLYEMKLVKGELELILDISAVTFLFPIALLCKQLFAKLTDRQFFLTFADYLDMLIFLMVVWVWETIKVYEVTPIKEELFGP